MNNLSDLLKQHQYQPTTVPIGAGSANHYQLSQTGADALADEQTTIASVRPEPEITPKEESTSTEPAQTTAHALDIPSITAQIFEIKNKLDGLLTLLHGGTGKRSKSSNVVTAAQSDAADGQIIEGVFNGEQMVGPDGKTYAVPPNYASKSKLVEGDIMKLTISPTGSFIYKQIAPVDRDRLIGTVAFDVPEQKWTIVVNGKHYKVLTASITFYKGKPGDEAVILVPKGIEAGWGAVENIISK